MDQSSGLFFWAALNNNNPGVIRSYPSIAQSAAQRDYTLPYRIWILARHADVKTNGAVKLSDLIATLALAGMNLSHYARARNSPGWSIFFKPHDPNNPDYVCYVKESKVRSALHCESERSVCELNLRGDIKSLHRFNAKNYAAWLADRPGGQQIIARSKLQELWGASLQTLLRWEKLLGLVCKEANFGTVSQDDTDKVSHLLPRDKNGDFNAVAANTQGMLIYQLPNTYTSLIPMVKRKSRGGKGEHDSGVATIHRVKRFVELDEKDRSWQLTPDRTGQHMRGVGGFLWSPKLMRVLKKSSALLM